MGALKEGEKGAQEGCAPFAWLERNTAALIIVSGVPPDYPLSPRGALRPRLRILSRGLPYGGIPRGLFTYACSVTVSTSAFARMELGGPLPVVTQLSLLAHAGHVIARVPVVRRARCDKPPAGQ